MSATTTREEGIATLVTERPKMVRRLLFDQLEESASAIGDVLEGEAYHRHRGALRSTAEKRIRQRLAEIQECMMLLEQVGWR